MSCRVLSLRDVVIELHTLLIFLPLNCGGLAMPDFTVLYLTAFVSSLRKSARINVPTFTDGAALKQYYLDFFPEVEAACATLAPLINDDTSTKDLIYDLVVEGASNLGSTLSNMVHQRVAALLVDGLSTPAAVGHRSSRLPEASSPFLLSYDFASRMDNGPFVLAVLMRIIYPFHPGRTLCRLCAMPAGESVNHDFVCTKSLEKRAANRHAGVMRAILDFFKSCTLINKTNSCCTAQNPSTATSASAPTNPSPPPPPWRPASSPSTRTPLPPPASTIPTSK